jgi:exopolysaccharide production protein ExoQ
LSYVVLQETLQIKDQILYMLGRDPSLTSRTGIWELVQRHEGNPWIGVGFMSFWTGTRAEDIWYDCQCGINQAHNGYLEQYVNLGYLGVGFIVAIMLSAALKIRTLLNLDSTAGILRFCFLVVAILYNYTEASFYGINNMWFLLMLGSIDNSEARVADAPAAAVGSRVSAPPQRMRPLYN